MTKDEMVAMLRRSPSAWNTARRENAPMAHTVTGRPDLRDADLRGAYLRDAYLRGAYLRGADLCGADLCGADLRDADLCGADLCDADLCGADLRDADLCGADLCGADLCDADLRDADLRDADLCDADLDGTVLDPKNKPNGEVAGFERDGDLIIGYRTAQSKICGNNHYIPGQRYTAPWFSTCQTQCHPGLYLYPHAERVRREYDGDVVRVFARAEDVHRVGSKWRAKAFVKVEAMS